MKCPSCQNAIECCHSIYTELDDRPIYISYQWWECKSCKNKYFAVCENSRVNIFDDRLEHSGYNAEEEYWQKTLDFAMKCPKPNDAHCKCEVHHKISLADFLGISAWYTYD
jgi:hypothetical protein